MTEKDPNTYAHLLSTFGAFGAAIWGGIVAHILHIRRHNKKFIWREAFMQVVVSGFSGVLATLLCLYMDAGGAMTGFMSGTAGVMGSRALEMYERKFSTFIGEKRP